MHGFDDGAGLWKKLGIKGEILATDKILHHQLWFAAAGALLAHATGDTRIQQRVERFLDKLESNLLVYPDGLIMQRIVPSKLGAGSLSFLNKGLGYLKRAVVNPLTGRGLRYKESRLSDHESVCFCHAEKRRLRRRLFSDPPVCKNFGLRIFGNDAGSP